jgi:hypothetical protein
VCLRDGPGSVPCGTTDAFPLTGEAKDELAWLLTTFVAAEAVTAAWIAIDLPLESLSR